MQDSGEEEEGGLGAKFPIELLNSTPSESVQDFLDLWTFRDLKDLCIKILWILRVFGIFKCCMEPFKIFAES